LADAVDMTGFYVSKAGDHSYATPNGDGGEEGRALLKAWPFYPDALPTISSAGSITQQKQTFSGCFGTLCGLSTLSNQNEVVISLAKMHSGLRNLQLISS